MIFVDIIAAKKYGYRRLPTILIARDGKILSDDLHCLTITRDDTIYHPFTHKFMDNHLVFTQRINDNEAYIIDCVRKKDISESSLLDTVPKSTRFIAKLLRMNPTYIRISGDVTVTHEKDGTEERYEETAIWEQMGLGKNKDAIIGEILY